MRLVTGFMAGVLLFSAQAWAWGALGHEVINRFALESMGTSAPPFLKANLASLEKMANVPDRTWRSGATRADEGPLHFFHWDIYQESELATVLPTTYVEAKIAVSEGFLHENGKAIWRVGQLYGQLLQAISANKCVAALQLAGTMGHYVADLSQPMHVTVDYDGQSIGKPGIHSHFETAMLAKFTRAELDLEIAKVIKDGIAGLKLQSSNEAAARDLAFAEAKISLEGLAKLIAIYRDGTIGNANQVKMLRPEVPKAMARGVHVLTQLWSAAFAKGSGSCQGMVQVPNPEWVKFPGEGT